jgi:hypothetical protein
MLHSCVAGHRLGVIFRIEHVSAWMTVDTAAQRVSFCRIP